MKLIETKLAHHLVAQSSCKQGGSKYLDELNLLISVICGFSLAVSISNSACVLKAACTGLSSNLQYINVCAPSCASG